MSVQVPQQIRRFNSMERRPRMLKDFLSENSNSCSSSGFKSRRRKLPTTTSTTSTGSVIEMNLKSRNQNSAFRSLINAVRGISFFTAVKKSPSMILPRSLSRKLSSSRSSKNEIPKAGEIKVTVKIKDIIRWESFRDLVEEHHQHPPPAPPPLDFHGCTTGSTTTTTTCSSSGSSWSDSDFTCGTGYVSPCDSQNDVELGKKFSPLVVGKDLVEPTTGTAGCTAVGAKLACQEDDEQQSPVSVLQLVGEDEFSPFDQSLAYIERRKQKFMQTIQRFESLAKLDLENLDQCVSLDEISVFEEEEYDDEDDDDDNGIEEQKRARQLLHSVKATGCCETYLEKLLLDFFREELSGRINQAKNNEFEWEKLKIADWINGSFTHDTQHDNKDACIMDMDRRGRWSRFEEEKEELALEIETAILHSLIADLELGSRRTLGL